MGGPWTPLDPPPREGAAIVSDRSSWPREFTGSTRFRERERTSPLAGIPPPPFTPPLHISLCRTPRWSFCRCCERTDADGGTTKMMEKARVLINEARLNSIGVPDISGRGGALLSSAGFGTAVRQGVFGGPTDPRSDLTTVNDMPVAEPVNTYKVAAVDPPSPSKEPSNQFFVPSPRKPTRGGAADQIEVDSALAAQTTLVGFTKPSPVREPQLEDLKKSDDSEMSIDGDPTSTSLAAMFGTSNAGAKDEEQDSDSGLELEPDLGRLHFKGKKLIPEIYQAAVKGGSELVVNTRMDDLMAALTNLNANLLSFAQGLPERGDVGSLKAAVGPASDLLLGLLEETDGYLPEARVVFKRPE